jgi:hypothetical protein
MSRRVALLQAIDRRQTGNAVSGAPGSAPLDRHQVQAVDILLNSAAAWRAFSIDDERPETIERYGPHKFGRSCLVARRLVEAGVPLVMVSWPSETVHWDTHAGHFPTMRHELLPPADRGCAALLEDLDERGLLDDTLVVWAGEFGRTPAINANPAPGRDHWPFVYSVLLAGAGIRGGQVYGSSDDIAAHPHDRPVHARDFVATIYHLLGYGPETRVTDPLGRQHAVVTGEPVLGLL